MISSRAKEARTELRLTSRLHHASRSDSSTREFRQSTVRVIPLVILRIRQTHARMKPLSPISTRRLHRR